MRPPSGQTEHGITPFQVRLLVLGLLAVAAFSALGWQLGRLTTDETWRNDAREALHSSQFRPTTRGPILDRDGRPLAVERPSWSFQVHYETLSGDWAFRQAQRDARREIGAAWSSLSGSDRHGETIARLGPWEDALEQVWEALVDTGLDRPELLARTEAIRDRTGRLLASVWRRRFERLVEQGYDDPEERFRMEPIAEQKRFYTLVDGLDQDGAFPLMTAIDRLDGLVRESKGDPSRDPAFRIQGESRRDRGFRRAVVELDRSTLPGPLRSNDPVPIEVVGVADTLIGTTRDRITEEDEQERPLFDPEDPSVVLDLTGYDDRYPSLVGSSGIEREFDRRLHGSIGFREENVATRTALQDVPPIPGESVQLAIDGDLQARVQAILDPEYGLMRSQPWQYGWRGEELREMIVPEGTPLHGAVVVLDVDTGETLALVSTPTVADLDLQPRDYELLLMPHPTKEDLQRLETQRAAGPDAEESVELERRITRMKQDLQRLEALPEAERERRRELIRLAPFRNRAIATEYAPGSIVKPLVYLAGVEGGKIGRRETIQCNGFVRGTAEQNLKPRCWIFRPERGWTTGHGPLDPVEAIARSCNVYFYRVADELGPIRMGAWYREQCGLGDALGPGFGAAADGTFRERQALGEIDRMIVGIGQGPFSWTPLHAATAYARLAAGGRSIRPRMILDHDLAQSPDVDREGWDPRAVDIALEGMRRSAIDGTAASIQRTTVGGRPERLMDFPDLGEAAPVVWAKTGTAQVTGKAPHAWYAGLVAPAGETRPRYAFAVIVEHGNSGGRAAGPVAGQVIRALVAEGYLGDEARRNLNARPVRWLDPIESFWIGEALSVEDGAGTS